MATINEIETTLNRLLEPIRTNLDVIATRLSILEVKQYNSSLGREQTLKPVPKTDGNLPTCPTPKHILELLVAGNEKLPNGEKNTWNKVKSKALLDEYGEDDYETETESEHSEHARARRIKVARRLGVTQQQLNWAQLTLW